MADFPQQFNRESVWQQSRTVKLMLLAHEVQTELNSSVITQAKFLFN